MRPFPFKTKLNNKGISLTELLVTLAVSGVVFTIIIAFISSGMRFFNKQNNTINIQNELQLVSNQLTETFQEATVLKIEKTSASGDVPATLKMITGTIPDGDVSFSDNGKYVYWDGNSLYIMDSTNVDDESMKGYCLSHYVTDFSVEINEDCKVYTNNGIAGKVLSNLTNPVIITFNVTVADNDEQRTTTLTCKIRNTLNNVTISDNGSQSIFDCK